MLGSAPRFLTYQAGTSLLHRLDARTKLLGTALIVADALLASVPRGMIIVYALVIAVGLTARHLLPALLRILRPLLVLLVFFGILIIVGTPGKAFARFLFMDATYEGVRLAIQIGLQALVIISTTSLFSLTTPPLAVADSLQWSLGWLERIRVPIRDIIAMVAIGLTFVPLLIEETQKVIAAQRARGADLGFNALLEEEAMGALLIPLLLANLRRGEELAESMEARLYGSGRRTSLSQHHFGRLDAFAGVVLLVVTAAVVGVSFFL